MAQDRPSTPHSTDGNYIVGDASQLRQVKPEPYTPPMPPTSMVTSMPSHSAFDPYGETSLYPDPTPVYYTPQHAMITSEPSQTPPQGRSGGRVFTRSGRAIATPSSPSNTASTRASASPAPRARRNLKKKPTKKGGPVIDKPLSVLTKDFQTPIKDMNAWVHRPVEDRMAEVEKRKGYISRPMNSFMLYRAAYADRVKQYCKENNHQVVSQVTGASWPLEPKEIRDMYERYAHIERDNHQAAHPNYKFAPNKSTKRARQDDDDASDSDPDWEGSTRSSKRSRSARRFDSRSASSTPLEDRPVRYHQPMPALNLSGYEISNPYGPPPLIMGPAGMVGEYYQPSTAMAPYQDQVSDIKFEKMNSPFPSYQATMGLLGLPHGGHHELLTSYPAPQQVEYPVQHNVLDPRLGQLDPNYPMVYYGEDMRHPQEIPRTISYEPVNQLEIGYQQEAYHPGLATLTEEHDVWGDAGQAGSDFDSEFQKLR
ncbi:hypothetical protein ABEF92_001582 [Exophiala dermatitidis]|uniref:HMG box domain-containing protein n=1 Tax=Exophiala dermatitidis (strain ATCC 34100 / CBS 525.76 / NIH/UT8656) TaxID=858893 RepID=H6BU54_EXODN|nr:uncharacterized protein HMPREF1120_03762 [Exophiala dermatitidis NIH/UT8656]EHY55632.1 hypothetical protein HMPREF1120_03762 [Exophiala dermatitidis NIH/UT8656]